jgi:hypothetical protein
VNTRCCAPQIDRPPDVASIALMALRRARGELEQRRHVATACAHVHLARTELLYGLRGRLWSIGPLAVLRPIARPVLASYRLWRGRSAHAPPDPAHHHEAVEAPLLRVSLRTALRLGLQIRRLPTSLDLHYPPAGTVAPHSPWPAALKLSSQTRTAAAREPEPVARAA